MTSMLRAAATLLLVAAACGGGGGGTPTGDVTVELRDFEVRPSLTQVKAGSLKIAVRNASASQVHELTIIKTDLDPDKLPVEGSAAKEDGKVAKSKDLNPGTSATLTVDLSPGRYLFICNQPGHYALGMRIRVTVQ